MMFEPDTTLFAQTHTLAPRMLFDSRDYRPRVRLFNPDQEDVRVQIHRRLGVMTDADEVKVVWSHQVITDNPEDFDDVSVASATEEIPTESDGEVMTPVAVSVTDLYERYASEVPAHIQSLLTETLKQLDEESDEEKKAITLLLIAYQDLFAVDETDIGKTDVITHDVDTGGCKPVCQAMRRQSKEEYEAMVSIVNNLRRCGIIQPSRSQWAANIRMAKKKSGQWRMCIDYRDLNKRTVINDPYPLPRIDALLDTLGRGTCGLR